MTPGGSGVIPHMHRPRSCANVAATLALFLGVAGGTAVAADLAAGTPVEHGSPPGGKDVRDGTRRAADRGAGARGALRGPAGPAGPAGLAGGAALVTVLLAARGEAAGSGASAHPGRDVPRPAR